MPYLLRIPLYCGIFLNKYRKHKISIGKLSISFDIFKRGQLGIAAKHSTSDQKPKTFKIGIFSFPETFLKMLSILTEKKNAEERRI